MGKRKLDENGAPSIEVQRVLEDVDQPNAPDKGVTTTTFESFDLDTRLLQAIAKAKYTQPTQVQAKSIPLALSGKDILGKSRTGSGKTAAYVLPTLQKVLRWKAGPSKEKATIALVLVPTRDLSDQITRVFVSFAEFCSKDVRALNLMQRVSDAVLHAKLQELPDIVVATPGRASHLVACGALSLDRLQNLVIDEADRILSYGYEDDIASLAKALPAGVQTFLLSATLTTDVEQLETLLCRDPVLVKIEDKQEEGGEVAQYAIKCGEEEKWLLIFVMYKLKLLKDKTIIFVADVDRSYRLKLYFEQFGIRSCVLNSELPVNSRLHVVEEFNKGLYNILIAADDQEVVGGVHRKGKSVTASQIVPDAAGQLTDEEDGDRDPEYTAHKSSAFKATDFSASRGIDFHNVSCVVNFDLPTSSKSYIHRVGRTARAGKSGIALSFVIPRDQYRKHPPTTHPSTKNNEKVLEKIQARQLKKGHEVKPYQFDMSQVDGFRYRMNDALRAVTRVAVREARAREIKQELIRSERLRKHFDENPEELQHLRRNDGGALGGGGIIRVQSHLKHVPDYLQPGKTPVGGSPGGDGAHSTDVGFVSFGGDNEKKRKRQRGPPQKGHRMKGKPRKNDPLKSFKGRSKT